MKIDVTKPILDLDGKPMKDPATKDDVLLRSMIERALLEPLRGDEEMKGDKKAQLYELAMRIHKEDIVDLDIDDVKVIRDRTDKAFVPLVVGRIRELIDPKSQETEEDQGQK